MYTYHNYNYEVFLVCTLTGDTRKNFVLII